MPLLAVPARSDSNPQPSYGVNLPHGSITYYGPEFGDNRRITLNQFESSTRSNPDYVTSFKPSFSFNYGGCQGNGNKFDTLEFCENRCKKGTGPRRGLSPIASGVDICNLPMKEGPCTENKPAWFFDYKTGQCSGFTYGGCEGNANRFLVKKIF